MKPYVYIQRTADSDRIQLTLVKHRMATETLVLAANSHVPDSSQYHIDLLNKAVAEATYVNDLDATYWAASKPNRPLGFSEKPISLALDRLTASGQYRLIAHDPESASLLQDMLARDRGGAYLMFEDTGDPLDVLVMPSWLWADDEHGDMKYRPAVEEPWQILAHFPQITPILKHMRPSRYAYTKLLMDTATSKDLLDEPAWWIHTLNTFPPPGNFTPDPMYVHQMGEAANEARDVMSTPEYQQSTATLADIPDGTDVFITGLFPRDSMFDLAKWAYQHQHTIKPWDPSINQDASNNRPVWVLVGAPFYTDRGSDPDSCTILQPVEGKRFVEVYEENKLRSPRTGAPWFTPRHDYKPESLKARWVSIPRDVRQTVTKSAALFAIVAACVLAVLTWAGMNPSAFSIVAFLLAVFSGLQTVLYSNGSSIEWTTPARINAAPTVAIWAGIMVGSVVADFITLGTCTTLAGAAFGLVAGILLIESGVIGMGDIDIKPLANLKPPVLKH